MKPANRSQFFQSTLGFKKVSDPGNPKETWLIPSDSNLKDEMLFKRQIPLRDAALQAFLAKLAANETPVFTTTELDPRGEFAEEDVNYTLALLNELTLNYLAQAIIDDERAIVKAMLDKKPELLLKRNIVIATSEYTGQRFSSDNFLGLACRRKQIEMVKIITPYFDKLIEDLDTEKDEVDIAEIEGIKNSGLSQWLKYPLQYPLDFESRKYIKVPEDYTRLINGLIDVFKTENITRNAPVKTLSNNVETAMNVLYERLLPGVTNLEITPENRPAMTKENHLDVELLLYAAYEAYEARYREFQTAQQYDAFCIRVIGIIQNFLPPETGKVFCEGLYYVVDSCRKISKRAEGLKLADGTTNLYCPLDLVLRKGCGFEYFIRGVAARGPDWSGDATPGFSPWFVSWATFLQGKKSTFSLESALMLRQQKSEQVCSANEIEKFTRI